MSLLMEALKKAEEAKRQAESRDGPAAAGMTAPMPSISPPFPSPSPSPPDPPADFLSDPAARFDAANAHFSATSDAPLPGRPALDADLAQERSAARNLFVAKRPEPANTLGLIVGAGILAVLGVGGYFWWQLQAIGSPSAARPTATPPAALPISLPPAETSVPARPIQEAAPPRPPVEERATSALAPDASLPPARSPARRPPASATAPAVDSPRREPSGAAIKLRPARAAPQANPALEHAYEALQSGRDGEARRAYEQVLRADGKNVDALLGLATLAARQGYSGAAHAYYLRALEADPNDATARAGVLATGGHGDEAAAESHLKTALAGQPDSPQLNFALGNLYARQQRWSEAQQAYFQAYTGSPGDPDVIFNLAVSLDHLRQSKLAAQYYRMALEAGGARAATFARDEVGARLQELTKTAR
jgi:tetratricopeptide (TPR) repeat protein